MLKYTINYTNKNSLLNYLLTKVNKMYIHSLVEFIVRNNLVIILVCKARLWTDFQSLQRYMDHLSEDPYICL